MDSYPEHEKLEKIKDQSRKLGYFLEWLQQQGLILAEWQTVKGHYDADGEWGEDRLVPVYINEERLLALYFGIDYDELMAEKQRIYETIAARANQDD